MTVWSHPSTIFGWRFKKRRALQIAGLIAACVAITTTLFLANISTAAPGINQTISFQGRLLNSEGEVVPDGYYNIQFKIYQDGTGTAIGNPNGTLKWTETYVNNGSATGAVQVKDGFLSVNLGSRTPFGNSIDWNQDTLWLSMNVAGSATTCTTFGTNPCEADGEMLPMKRLTASPYALNAGKLGGIASDGFIQNRTTQQTGNFNISGTGRANLLQGVAGIEAPLIDRGDAGTLSIGTVNATSIVIGSVNGNQTISIGTGTGNKDLTIGSNDGESSLTLQGGSSGVNITSAGGLIVRNETIDRDTLVIGDDGSTSINLSDATDFTVNDAQDQSVLTVGSNGTIQTGTSSNLAVRGNAQFTQGVKIGDGQDNGEPAFLTLDRSDSTPIATGNAVLGSMYYDTTLGKVQCYEADGWGACSSSPDNFVTISPEYTNAVTNGTGTGDLTSDICSDTLSINTNVCDTNETYNYYNWTSDDPSAQTKSIYVTYQLPANFKKFIAGSTFVTGKTDSEDASVSYQIYKNTGSGLVECGVEQLVATDDVSWQKVTANGLADPANCSFAAGQSLVIRINLTASNGANAYASTLGFAFSDD